MLGADAVTAGGGGGGGDCLKLKGCGGGGEGLFFLLSALHHHSCSLFITSIERDSNTFRMPLLMCLRLSNMQHNLKTAAIVSSISLSYERINE